MKFSDNIAIFLFVTIIIILGLYSNKTGVNAYLYWAISITIIVSVFIKKEFLLVFFILLVAPNRLLTIASLSAPSIVAVIGFFRYLPKRKLNQKFLIGAICFIMLELSCSVIVNTNVMIAVKIVVVLAFFLFSIPQYKKKGIYLFAIYLAIGCIWTAFLTIIIEPSTLIEVERFGFSDHGQNVLGILCGGLILLILGKKQNYVSKRMKYAIIISLLFIGFITGSRSFILELGIGIVIYIGYALFHLQKRNSLSIIMSLCIIGFLGYVALQNIDILSNYLNSNLDRFNKYAENDISNNRFDLWELYIDILRNNKYYLLFGGVPKQELVAHNMIIEQVASIGLIGSLVVLYLYWIVFNEIKNKLRVSYCVTVQNLSPLFSFLSASMVSHTLLGIPQTLMLFICLLNLTTKKN